MGPYSSNCCDKRSCTVAIFGKICVAMLAGVFATAVCGAQEIKLNVTYVCNGEHIWVDSCNIRDLSDTATCMVEHPDHVNAGGDCCDHERDARIAEEEAADLHAAYGEGVGGGGGVSEEAAGGLCGECGQGESPCSDDCERRAGWEWRAGADCSSEECRGAGDAAVCELGAAAGELHGQSVAGGV